MGECDTCGEIPAADTGVCLCDIEPCADCGVDLTYNYRTERYDGDHLAGCWALTVGAGHVGADTDTVAG